MQRKFVLNIALLLLLNFLIKPFWIFGVDRTVQNTISSNDYGIYFALFNFTLLFNILLDIGLTNFNNKNISQYSQLLSKYFSGIVAFKLILALLYFIVTMVVGYFVGYNAYRFHILFFLSVNQFFISFIQYLRSNIAGLQLYTLDSLFSVLDKTLMIVCCSILLWGNILEDQFNLMHFIYGQTISYFISALIIFLVVLAKVQRINFRVNIPFLLVILKQTLPYALLVLTMTFYYRLDAVMLDYMLDDGEYQASVYAQAYRLMDASNQIGVLFAGLLLPMFAVMIIQNKPLDKLVKLSFSFLFFPALTLAFISSNFSNEIMAILYSHDVSDAVQVFPVLMFCFVAIATTYIFGTLLTANGNLKLLNKLALLGLMMNIILNLLLIPKYKAYGSAVASMITQFFVVVIQIYLSKKIFQFNTNYRFIVRLVVFVITMFFITFLTNNIHVYWTIKVILLAISSVLLGFLLKLFDIKEMYQLILNREVEE